MLIQDMINLPFEALPVIFLDFSVDEAIGKSKLFPYNTIPVIDRSRKFIGVFRKSNLKNCPEINIRDCLEYEIAFSLENENALKLQDAFNSPNNIDLLFVLDKQGFLLGAVSHSNPVVEHIQKASSFIPVSEVFDAMHDAIIIIDADATIVYANHAYTELLGVPLWKIVGRPMPEVEPTSRCLRILHGDKSLVNERIRIKSVDKEVVATITPIYRDNKRAGVVSVFRSIDETLQLSHKIKHMEYMNRYLKNELEMKSKLPTAFESIIGKNGRFVEALSLAAQVSRSNVNVIIRGENGTGKEVVANALHNASARREFPMIRVNCAAIPENLLESELFGYESGAFTGAQKSGKMGKFELADKGTIFLDEIGDMNLSMQAKILRVIQEKKIERVGGTQVIDVDVRIISATNKNLEKMILEGTFREDIYYRLNVVSVMLPPLRERIEDIPLLVEHFCDLISNEQGIRALHFSREAMEILMDYKWKGNIRELQNAVEHAAVICKGDTIHPEDLPRYLWDNSRNKLNSSEGTVKINEVVKRVERQAIMQALEKCNQNKSAAMRTLGISRRTFYKKLAEYQIVTK